MHIAWEKKNRNHYVFSFLQPIPNFNISMPLKDLRLLINCTLFKFGKYIEELHTVKENEDVQLVWRVLLLNTFTISQVSNI